MGACGDQHEPPVELRFIDLFMIVIAALVLVTVPLLLRGISRDRPPEIVSKVVPAAMLNEPYRVTLAAAGGLPPLTWSVVEGALPRGLALKEGRIAGSPVEAASKRLVLQLEDARGGRDRATLEIDVLDFILPEQKPRQLAIEVEEVVLPDAASDEPYAAQLATKGGVLPHRWQVAAGRLPPGLSLDSQGLLAGSPQGDDLPLLWMLFAVQSARHQRLRESNSYRFEAVVADRAGQRVRQGVTVYVEPQPRSFFWQLFLREFVSPVSWPWRVLSWVLSIVFFVAVGLTCLLAIAPLCLFFFGFQAEDIRGWRGLLWRPHPTSASERRPVGPLVASLALVVEGLLTFIDKVIHFRLEPGGGSGGGGTTSRGQEVVPVPNAELPALLMVVGGVCAGGSGNGGRGSQRTEEEDDYLKNLERGGVVKYGGAFLGLSFVRRADLEGIANEAFQSLPEVGKGLLHVSLDRFLRHLLVLSAGRDRFSVLDERFDVVLGRKGPASPLPHEMAQGRDEPNFQGRMTLPSELDPDAHRPGQLQDVLSAIASEDRLRLQACGVAMSESALRQIVLGGAAEQLGGTMEAAATQARRWMGQLRLEALGDPVRESVLLRILRASAHVRLEEGILHVRLTGLTRTCDQRAAEALCRSLDAFDPRTLAPHELPVRCALLT